MAVAPSASGGSSEWLIIPPNLPPVGEFDLVKESSATRVDGFSTSPAMM